MSEIMGYSYLDYYSKLELEKEPEGGRGGCKKIKG